MKGLDVGMGKRKRQLTSLVYVGEGSSHGRQRVEAQEEAAHISQKAQEEAAHISQEAQEEEAHISQEARPIASNDDETQEPGT